MGVDAPLATGQRTVRCYARLLLAEAPEITSTSTGGSAARVPWFSSRSLRTAGARRQWGPPIRALLTLLAGALLWFGSVAGIDIRAINDLGLISQAPPAMLVGTVLIALGFVLTIRLQPLPVPLALAATLLLIFTIHGLPTYVEDAPRFTVAYLHAGFTDVIARDGTLLPGVDARFSWPLFFSWGALVTQVAGIANAIAFQPWAPIAFNLLYLVPLLVIFRAFTSDERLIWAALFIFFATQWVGQDYYAPQAFNYLLYLAVLAIVLRWFGTRDVPGWIAWTADRLDRRWERLRAPMRAAGGAPPRPSNRDLPGGQRAALVGVIVLLTAASVASHQLTPFALLAAVTALTVIGRNQLRGLPILVGVMTAAWISYMTVVFLAGNLPGLLDEIFAAAQTADANVGQRLSGSFGHVLVVEIRLIFTLLLFLVAALGGMRRYRWGNLDLEAATLALVPFGLMLFQAYGGEILLRVYLFSLPFMAFFVAGLFFPSPARAFSPAVTRALAATLAILLVVLLITKHGNERADYISADEFNAVNWLYGVAPAGSQLAAVNFYGPVRYQNLELYRYELIPEQFLDGTPADVIDRLDVADGCVYLFVSRSQRSTAELFDGVTEAQWDAQESAIAASGSFALVYHNPDASIYLALPAEASCRAS